MTREGTARLTMVLATTAALLAFAAAAITYSDTGEVKWTLIAAGLFILTFGISTRSRTKPPDA